MEPYIRIVSAIAFVTTLVGLAPQVIKIARNKSARDVSMLMLINYFICTSSWVAHGYLVNDKVVIISNVVGLFVGITLIIQKCYYAKQ